LKCEKKFELPIKFEDSSLEIDLGRTILLNILSLKLDPIILPENFTFPNFTLQISNISSSDNSSTSCSFLNRVNFIVKFNCRKKLGRILTAKMMFISNENMTLEVGNFSATGNRLTTNNNSEVDNLVNIKAKLKCTNLSTVPCYQNTYFLFYLKLVKCKF